ncbi:MAG: hypothetical protein DME32_09940 [Verrucomicrobia bacterium]|nr:MAG: hypothetical protein DME32_09940 [Verrucomicrobiota bacterium]
MEDRLLNFAVEIIELTEALPNTRAVNHVAGQLLRSGTSPYGNHGEVEAAEPWCLKEADELIRIFKASINTAEEKRR